MPDWLSKLVKSGSSAFATAIVEWFSGREFFPINPVIKRDLGFLAMAFAVSTTFVFSRFPAESRRILSCWTVVLIPLLLILVSPFIVDRFGYALGFEPRAFAIVARYAYLGFHIVLGIWLGIVFGTVAEKAWKTPGP